MWGRNQESLFFRLWLSDCLSVIVDNSILFLLNVWVCFCTLYSDVYIHFYLSFLLKNHHNFFIIIAFWDLVLLWYFSHLNIWSQDFLVVQRLRLRASSAGGPGSISDQGSRFPHAATKSLHAATKDLTCCN